MKNALPGDDAREVPAARHPQRALADAAALECREVADGLPAQAHQRVHRPDVVLLEAVPGPRGLGRREARERSLGGVVVEPSTFV